MRPYFDNSKPSVGVAVDTAEQLLTELIEPGSDVKFIKYNAHRGLWTLKGTSDDIEFENFADLYTWMTHKHDPESEGEN